MIIAAYAGAGKTFFARQVEGAVDLVTMPHSCILPPLDQDTGEFEHEKGGHYFLRDPRYPDNYILEILKAERKYPYVLIPTNARIISQLWEKYARRVILCYPTQEQKNDYQERFLVRGNSPEFLEIFIGRWEKFLMPFWKREIPGNHLPLLPGEFIMDKKDCIEIVAGEDTSDPVSNSVIEKLMEEQIREHGDFALYLSGDDESMLYCVPDIDCAEERSFLYHLGRKIYDEADLIPLVAPQRLFKPASSRFTWTDDKSKVCCFVDRYKLPEEMRREI